MSEAVPKKSSDASPAKPKRILVLCPFPQGVAAGQRLKYEQHLAYWKSHGYEVDVSPYMDMAMWNCVYKKGFFLSKVLGVLRGHMRRLRDLFRVSLYDVVYVFMWVTPFGTNILERATRALSRKIVYDVEDNLLIKKKLALGVRANPIMELLRGPSKTIFLMKTADLVITASPLLNEKWQGRNDHLGLVCITPSLDCQRYVPSNTYSNSKTVTIGWTGTFSTRVYLDLLRPVFARLAKIRSFKLLVIGNFEAHFEGLDYEIVQWTSKNEIADLSRMDIGLYPLSAEDEWVLGKAGLKAMQYMAMGLPCVATDVSTTPLVVQNDVNGLLVTNDDEWLEALVKLIDDPALRRRIGQAGRKTVEQRYSLEAVRGQYLTVLNRVYHSSMD